MNRKLLTALHVGLLLSASCASGASSERLLDCGNPSDNPGGYGPFDYRTATHDQKYIVEVTGGHFTKSVETLQGGTTGTIGGELNYTLHVFPNHPRALMTMIRLAQRDKTNKPVGSKYTVECWIERGVQFRPDDTNVRQIRSVYYSMQRKYDLAIADLKVVIEQQPDSGNAHYNLGLAYFETGNYADAVAEAKQAQALGFPLQGLKVKLKAKGKWVE